MKDVIKLSRTQNIVLASLFILIVSSIFIYFIRNYFEYQEWLKKVKINEIKGIIIDSKKEERCCYYIKINDLITKTKIDYSLSGDFFFIDNKIKVGDSVYKKPNSKIMIFYKPNLHGYEKCCEYELEM